jgi:hypothetical protein
MYIAYYLNSLCCEGKNKNTAEGMINLYFPTIFLLYKS